MNILHSTTDPSLLQRLKEMLGSSARADIAVGYFFISGFEQVSSELGALKKVRILVGRTDRQVVEQVALGLQQAEALQAKLEADSTVRRSQQEALAAQAVAHVADGVAALPQTEVSERAVAALRDMVSSGKVEVKAYLRSTLHAKAYLCWYEHHAEPGAAVVGSSNFTLAGFTGNTELNVRVTGDAEMAELKRWFEELWADSKDISAELVAQLDRSWPLAQTTPYQVYLKALYELYGDALLGGGPRAPKDHLRTAYICGGVQTGHPRKPIACQDKRARYGCLWTVQRRVPQPPRQSQASRLRYSSAPLPLQATQPAQRAVQRQSY